MSGFSNYLVTKSGFLVRTFIRSFNYVAGAAGWTINADGSAEFNNLTVRGTFAGTDFIINSSGAFFYSGVPATGNLIASIASAAGTDAHGNAYNAGINVYGTSSTYVQMLTAAIAQINLGTGDAAEATPGRIDNFIAGSGATRGLNTRVSSPKVSGLPSNVSTMFFASPAVNGSSDASWGITASNGTSATSLDGTPTGLTVVSGSLTSTGGTAANPTLVTTDGWHSLGTLAGYTVNSAAYRLTTEGEYEIDVNVTGGGANAATVTFANALPAGYGRGPSSIAYPLTVNKTIAAGEPHPRLVVTSAGAVALSWIASNTSLVTGQCFVPTS